jgi:hypothetical protein
MRRVGRLQKVKKVTQTICLDNFKLILLYTSNLTAEAQG